MHLTGRQVDGLIVVVMLAVAVGLMLSYSAHMVPDTVGIAHGDRRDGPVVVKLSGGLRRGGIYYLPANTKLSGLFAIAGIERQDRFDQNILARHLSTGESIMLDADSRVTFGQMDAAERLAMGLAIDLNRATADELMLIPGIGEGTATRIVQFRETTGSFKRVADLKNVKGIKEKKYKQWERYFYLPP